MLLPEIASLHERDEDPFGTAAERIPLARPRVGHEGATEATPESSVRPFGLRFAVGVPAVGAPLPPWRYCLDRQIAVGEDGEPWRLVAGATMATTGPSSDGGPSTGGEEWTPDQEDD